MRYLILSDIHANLEALEAVLRAAPRDRFDRLLVLGDLVGYGADPNAVVDRIRALRPDVLIRGNHDKVASGVEEPDGFNFMARDAAHWTFEQLTPENREFVAGLPVGPVVVDDLVQVCHGAPFDEDAYIFDALDALQALKIVERPICFFGHTHVPAIFWLSSEGLDTMTLADPDTRVALRPDCRYLVNPGSVGQPRDGDPRAAYGVLDGEKRELTLHRVAYAIEAAQSKILSAGLPEPLAHRLSLGR